MALDVRRVRLSRGINAVAALSMALCEVLFAAAAVLLTAREHYHQAAVATMISGLAVTVDNALRLRENAASHHDAYEGLKALTLQLTLSTQERDPLLQEYQVLTQSSSLDYVTAILALCFARYR